VIGISRIWKSEILAPETPRLRPNRSKKNLDPKTLSTSNMWDAGPVWSVDHNHPRRITSCLLNRERWVEKLAMSGLFLSALGTIDPFMILGMNEDGGKDLGLIR